MPDTPPGPVSDHPDDEKLDESYAAITESRRQGQRSTTVEMSLVAAAAVLITLSTAFGAWNTFELRKINQDAAEIRKLLLLGTECVVAEAAEHRELNALAHRANAEDHGYTYPIPPDSEPPAIPGVLEKACRMFVQTTSTSRP